MNKRLIITVVIVIGVLIGIAVWKSAYSSSANQQTQATAETNTAEMADANDPRMKNKTREELVQEYLTQQLLALQKRPGNITQFLNHFRESCDLQNCDAALAKALQDYSDQDFAQIVRSLLARLPSYEKAMQSTVLPTSMSPQERFEKLWELREQTLGREEAMVGFGEERQYADYRFAYHDLTQNQNLDTEQRLKAFEDLQLKYMDVTGQDGNIGVYEQALQLLQHQKQNPQELEQLKSMLQDRYLTEDEKQDIRARDDRQEKQQQQADKYQQAVKELQQDMAPLKERLSEADWERYYQTKLEELRKEMFL